MQARPFDSKLESQIIKPDHEAVQIDFMGKDLDFIRSTVDFLPAPAYWVGNDGRFIFVNKAACGVHGFSREEFLDMTVYDIDSGYSPELWQEHRKKAELQGSIVFESHRITREGADLPIEVTVNHQEFGDAEYFCAFAQDISKRKSAEIALKKAEETLHKREAMLRSIYKVTPTGIGMVVNRGFSWVNDRVCEMLGYSNKEIKKKGKGLYLGPDEYSRVVSETNRQIREHGIGTVETRWKRKDGEIIDVLLRSSPLERADFSKGIIFTILDISDRKHAEEVLCESEAKYRDLVETVSDVIWEVDTEGIYTYVSPNSKDIFGYAPEELVGKPFYAIMPPDEVKQIQDYFTEHKVSPEPIENLEITFVQKNGNFVLMENNIKPFFDAKGALVGYRGVDRDVTEKKRLQAEAVRASHLAALGELAAGVAHEINNPINGVINYAEILKDEFEEREEDADIPNRIIKEGVRIAEIVRTLLAFSRDKKEEFGSVSIEGIVSDTLSLVERQMLNGGIMLSVGGLSDLPEIKARYREIQQVVLNIISNARYAVNEKYPTYDDDKVIQISGEKIESDDKAYIRLIFHDSGNGIPEKILDKVCNPFFSTKPKNKGTGLGLSISLEIVKSHGGALWFKSKEGQYQKVIVDLPVWEEGPEGRGQTVDDR